MINDDLASWLLDSDPALRWQVQRDLLQEPPEVWEATRRRIPTEGFGAALLAKQDPDGQWAGGAYFPSASFNPPDDLGPLDGQPWIATTWSLNFLRDFGMDPAPLLANGTAARLAANSRWDYDDLPYWGGEVDCCINAFTLQNGIWLGLDMAHLASWFVDHRLDDGGWNCEWVEGATRSSFDSTLNSLKGLLAWEQVTGNDDAATAAGPAINTAGPAREVRTARLAGQEYLLTRSLMNRASTGRPFRAGLEQFTYPVVHLYTLLNAADWFREQCQHDRTAPDPRMAGAIEIIRAARQADGTWLQSGRVPGWMWFEVDVPAGERSKWLTLIGTRVLDWWDQEDGTTRRPARR